MNTLQFFKDINLGFIPIMKKYKQIIIGHQITLIETSIAAVALGAKIIEKCLSR